MMTSVAYPQLHLDQQLCFATYTASRLITKAYMPHLKTLGITYPQYLVLLVLWQASEEGTKAVTMRDMGNQLFLDSGTLTPLLRRMEKNGLITKRRDEADERIVMIALTYKGIELREKAKEVPNNLACQVKNAGGLLELRDSLKGLIQELHESD